MTELSKEQQEVYDSIPKWIFQLPPEEFAKEFTTWMMLHPNIKRLSKGNQQVESIVKDVTEKAINEHFVRDGEK